MGIGIVLSILSTLVSAWVEDHRRHLALTKQSIGFEPKKGVVSSTSALWLIPKLVITRIADAFFSIGHTEFYYKQFPENMRSIANAFPGIPTAVSNFLTGFLISAMHNVTSGSSSGVWLSQDLNKGKLRNFYYTIAALGIVNLGYFLVCASLYQHKQTPGNDQLSAEANRD